MSWKVVDPPQQGPVQTPAGNYVPGWTLTVTMDDGNTFTVDVTSAQWASTSDVKAAIQTEVDRYKANTGLTG